MPRRALSLRLALTALTSGAAVSCQSTLPPAPPPATTAEVAPQVSPASSLLPEPVAPAPPPPPVAPAPAPQVSSAPEAESDACPPGMGLLAGGTLSVGSGRVGGRATVKPFCLDLTEVTADAYAACALTGGCTTDHVREASADGVAFKADRWCNYGVAGRGAHPMNCVDWAQADAFCRGVGKRLPSEEEWQWAARGGPAATRYPWGNAAAGTQPCWSGFAKRKGTCPAGSNPLSDAPGGFHDLLGNVWEWTSTPFSIWVAGSTPDMTHATLRIARGGGWSTTDPTHLTGGVRNWRPAVDRTNSLGFRCAR